MNQNQYARFEGRYFDGKTSREYHVDGQFEDTGLRFHADGLENEEFWSFDTIRRLPDQAADKGVVIHPEGHIGRLIIDNPVSASIVERRAKNLDKREVNHAMRRRAMWWGGAAVASVLLILFVIIPSLANQLAKMLPLEREVALGRAAMSQIESFLTFGKDDDDEDGGLTCSSTAGDAALVKMTERLTATFDNPYPLDVRVFDHPMINAFAVPGGHVVLFNGLLQAADTPEEVAGVLGHELGHVINRDPTRLTLRSGASAGILGMVFGDFAGGAAALIVAERLIAANYQQDAESEADLFAIEALSEAGLPTAPFGGFFEKLAGEYGDDESLMSHIASHPSLQGRADAAKAADTIGGKDFVPVLTQAEWTALKSICDTPQN